MTTEMINTFMDSIIRGTLTGICLSFWILGMVAIWKWFLGIMKRALLYIFPGLKTWCEKQRKQDKTGKKVNTHGNCNDTEQAGGLDHRDQLF